MRRAFDVLAALFILLLTAPLLVLAALAILLTSGRPLFFGHLRVGRNGVPFRCWKLRTMEVGAESALREIPALHERYVANGFKLSVAEDPRVTRLGRWLRRSYIDELPQLFNVLNGTMALVGPRPVVADELAHYGGDAPELLATRPGIFGAWAAEGRARPPYPQRVTLEMEYVRTRSFTTDLSILMRCVPVVLQGNGPDG
jgi:lipopolysaccharide/colanic/teichoic acid biosynthesis glycosyltransferase